MKKPRQQTRVPRWAVAAVAGLCSAALLIAVLRLGLGMDLGLAVFFGGGLGLAVAFLVARWVAGAELMIGVLDAAVSALVAIVSIIAAVVGALS
jgi:hypothetical protein